MKASLIPPIIYKLLGIKNVAGNQINPATEEKQDMIAELVETKVIMKAILSIMQMPRNADTANNADRVTVQNTPAVSLASTTLSSGNVSSLNGQQSHQMAVASEISAWYIGQRSTII